jgi:hypothetical protein
MVWTFGETSLRSYASVDSAASYINCKCLTPQQLNKKTPRYFETSGNTSRNHATSHPSTATLWRSPTRTVSSWQRCIYWYKCQLVICNLWKSVTVPLWTYRSAVERRTRSWSALSGPQDVAVTPSKLQCWCLVVQRRLSTVWLRWEVQLHHCCRHQSFLRSLVILGSGVAIWRLDGELIRACGKWRHQFVVCCWQYRLCGGETAILCWCCVLCVCVCMSNPNGNLLYQRPTRHYTETKQNSPTYWPRLIRPSPSKNPYILYR